MTDGGRFDENLGKEVELPEGWRPLYRTVVQSIADIDPNAMVIQTKEKFGELRIYMKTFNEQIYDLIDEASKQSKTICQTCGSLGVWSKTADGFYATVCADHSAGFAPAMSSVLRHMRLILPNQSDGEV